jgi:hypothetical protein
MHMALQIASFLGVDAALVYMMAQAGDLCFK